MSRLWVPAVAALLGGLLGCASGTTGPSRLAGSGTPVVEPSTPATLPQVELVRSGGVGGVHEQVTVTPDGRWTYLPSAGPAATPTNGQLDEEERADLARAVADPRLTTEAGSEHTDPRCADGFQHVLRVRQLKVSWYACSGGPPAATEVARLLGEMTEF